MTIRQRFSDFIESLQEPRRKFGVVCFLLSFLCADFLFAAVYFLYGFFALKTIGPAAEMAADITETYKISVYVDTSEYLYWSIPFFVLAVATGALLAHYVISHRYLRHRARKPVRAKERIRAQEDAVVAVRVKAVNPDKAKQEDLHNKPPAWLLDPLAVVNEPKKQPVAEPVRKEEQPQPQQPYQPFTYADFVNPARPVSTPHNTVQRPKKRDADIPYAGSLQYVPRTDKKKKNESPYSPDRY
ncbi:MAG: hypothetical protein E7523_04535 [Ruminococcaceae bacterium]|nr:hypothetical protein [Oscillospiraceae bacterium]